MTISALRDIQNEAHPGSRPHAPQLGPRPTPPDRPITPTPAAAPAPVPVLPALYDLDEVLKWAAGHDDLAVRKDAERVANGIERLRTRMADDIELARLEQQRAELLTQLAAVDGRRAEIRPTKTKTGKGKTNPDTAAIRAWAADNGHEIHERGRIPQEIQDAYYAAHPTVTPAV